MMSRVLGPRIRSSRISLIPGMRWRFLFNSIWMSFTSSGSLTPSNPTEAEMWSMTSLLPLSSRCDDDNARSRSVDQRRKRCGTPDSGGFPPPADEGLLLGLGADAQSDMMGQPETGAAPDQDAVLTEV